MSEPQVSIDQHVRRTQIAFGQELTSRRAIYLDKRFWILLRDAARGECAEGANELLNLLRHEVANGKIFCPISEAVFVELMKQADFQSRLTTAELIDELSLGATLIREQERLGTEVAHFLHAALEQFDLHPLEHLVWSKLSYVLGVVHPSNTRFDVATEQAIQKAFFDHMWTVPLRQMIETIGDNGLPQIDFDSIATRLNAGIASHAGELRSFEQSYSAEVRGIADLMGDTAVEIMISMASNSRIELKGPTPEERSRSESYFKNLITLALERKKARKTLRTMHILASLHASVRWNKGRKLGGNDLVDFHHAAGALAYCDAFFTERSLRTTVTQNHLALDSLYDCFVTNEVEEAIAFLSR